MLSEERLKEYASCQDWDDPDGLQHDGTEMARELLALRWKPITPESLPKMGDEVFDPEIGILEVDEYACRGLVYKKWKDFGATHYRPINPPEKEQ